MADIRESFPTLEDGSGVGQSLAKIQEGDAVAAKNAQIAFSHKDSSGNAIAAPVNVAGDAPANAKPVLGFLNNSGNLAYGNLDASGRLKTVQADGATGNGKTARGSVSGNTSLTTVASLTLTTSKIYDELDFVVCCTRDALFQVILSDNASETILSEAIVGSGQPSFHGALKAAEISTGATGAQLLLIKAKNLVAASLSDFHASVSVNQN